MDKININNLFANANAGKRGEINVNNIFDYEEDQTISTIELNIDKMLDAREEKRKQAKYQYQRIFGNCANKINDAISIGKEEIIFDIPIYVPLIHEYSYIECKKYIQNRIKKLDMDIAEVSNLSFFISWEHVEINRKNRKERQNNM